MRKQKTKLSEKLNYLSITTAYLIFFLAMNKLPHLNKRKVQVNKKDTISIMILVISLFSTSPIWIPILALSVFIAHFENKKRDRNTKRREYKVKNRSIKT
ncbi:MAG: hypothetical protein L3J07_03245 [Candidatus Magasanikbacteria bacterium]|nr:hypothetical protein [Candidatus Magasanikbacteria bacterium]